MLKHPLHMTTATWISLTIALLFASGPARGQTLHHFRFESDPGLEADSVGTGSLSSRGTVEQVPLPSAGRGAHFPAQLAGIGPNEFASETTGTSGFLSRGVSTVDEAFTIEMLAHFDRLDSSANRSVLAGQAGFPRSPGGTSSTFSWAFVAERIGTSTNGATSHPRELELWASDGSTTWLIPSRLYLEEATDYHLSASFAVDSDVSFTVRNLATNTSQTVSVPHQLNSLNPHPLFGIMWPEGWARVDGIVDEVRFSAGVLTESELLVNEIPDSVTVLPRAAYGARSSRTRDYRSLSVASVHESLVLKFDIPDLGDSAMEQLQTAKLRVFIGNIRGDEETAEISLFHSATDNDFEILLSDQTDPSYADTNLDVFKPGDATNRYFELDVTDWLQTDYLQDGDDPVASFRLDVTENFLISMAASSSEQPELVLSFVPEPAGHLLLVMGLLFFARYRARQKL